MKTGRCSNHSDQINLTSLTLIGLDIVLKRVSLQDMFLYLMHNNLTISPDLFCHSVCFNLFSEWGIGKKLEPIIVDAFDNSEKLAEKYSDNIFYKEAARLSKEIVSELRKQSNLFEWSYQYITKSAFSEDEITSERFSRLFPLIGDEDDEDEDDEIEGDEDIEDDDEDYDEDDDIDDYFILDEDVIQKFIDNDDIDINEFDEIDELLNDEQLLELLDDGQSFDDDVNEVSNPHCSCKFCVEFSKYCYPKEKNVEEIISEVLEYLANS